MGFGDVMRMADGSAIRLDCGHPNKDAGELCEICGQIVPGELPEMVRVDRRKLAFIKERCLHGRDQGGPAAQCLQLIERTVDEILADLVRTGEEHGS